MRKSTKNIKDKSGVSLIIAIIFVSAFMLVMAGLFEARLRVIQAVGNREQEAKARYLAEGASEHALLWAATHGIGANGTDDPDFENYTASLYDDAGELGFENCADTDGDLTNGNQPCIEIKVIGRSSDTVQISGAGSSYYSVPIKATGNVGICDAAHPESDADGACNWNKLYVGESVEIPLFYEESDADGDGNLDPSAHNFGDSGKEFKLRVRAPTCSPPSTNCVGGRYELYPLVGSTEYRRVEEVAGVGQDPVLIQWSISDVEGGAISTLVARDTTVNDGGVKKRSIITPNDLKNTEISAGRINLAKSGLSINDRLSNFTVLQYVSSSGPAEKHFGKDLNGNEQLLGSYISNLSLEKPVLRLNLVGQPQKDDGNPALTQNVNDNALDIPYLEYQVLAKDIQISDSKSSIVGWAEIGGFKKEIRKQKQRTGTLGGFALESF